MPIKLIFLLVLFPSVIFAQKETSIISGSFDKPDENKFVYLYTPPVDDFPEQLITAPIINQQVLIKKDFDQKGRLFRWGLIFIAENDKITLGEFKEIKKDYNFIQERELLIILEDSVKISFKEPIGLSEVRGNILNAEWQDLFKAIKENKYIDFVKTHPDSPFALHCLNAIKKISLYTDKLYDADIPALFNSLSDRIKQSVEGKEFSKKI